MHQVLHQQVQAEKMLKFEGFKQTTGKISVTAGIAVGSAKCLRIFKKRIN